MIHELKTLPEYFEAVINGEKTFEVRKFDRPFHKGDLLALNEYDPKRKCYTGRSCLVYIDYLLTDTEYVRKDYVILGIKPCSIFRQPSPHDILGGRFDYRVPLATQSDEERSEKNA